MANKILDALIRPDSFFSKKISEPVNLKIPALVALVGALIGAMQGYYVSGMYAQMFSGEMAGMAAFMGIMGAVSAFLAFFIVWWLAFSILLYLVSMFFSGKGPLKRTLEFVGYGLIPTVIGSFITLCLSVYYIPKVSVPIVRSVQDPAQIQEIMAQLLNDPAMREFSQVSGIISIIFLIWTANIWIFGMKYARELNLKHAVFTVAIPVLVYIVYIFYTIFSGFSPAGGL